MKYATQCQMVLKNISASDKLLQANIIKNKNCLKVFYFNIIWPKIYEKKLK